MRSYQRHCSQRCQKEAHKQGRDPAKERDRWLRRDTRLSGRLHDLTTADRRVILASRTFCPLCRRKMNRESGHPRQKVLDHIVPIVVGGTDTWGNVRVICADCNGRRPKDGSDVEKETLWARSR